MNVIDNFLFHQMLTDKDDGEEFAKILLQTFLGRHIRNVKIIPQKTILGIYTVKNHCVEDPSIPSEDGATKIYLYTNGNADNASQPLKDMLKYIQNSTDDNVTNQDIATIQQLAQKVKRKKEVGINYMKSWEYEKWIKEEAYKEGFDEGKSDGYDTGYDSGFGTGFNDGFQKGMDMMKELTRLLTEANRQDDIVKAIQDKDYLEQLLKEFHLTE